MEEPFILMILYKGQEYSFEARLATVGYTHKLYVLIEGIEVTYEPDEERKYRAIINEPNHVRVNEKLKELIKKVRNKIEELHSDGIFLIK